MKTWRNLQRTVCQTSERWSAVHYLDNQRTHWLQVVQAGTTTGDTRLLHFQRFETNPSLLSADV